MSAEAKTLKYRFLSSIKKYWFIYILIAPGIITLIIYAYGPMILQGVLAFTNYKFVDGIFGSEWVGFDNFTKLFNDLPVFDRLISNTVILSILYFLSGFFPSLILAVMLFDLSSNKVRKAAQTIVYIPYFFSWVIVYSIFYSLLSNTGIINGIIMFFGGQRTEFLLEPKYIRTILIVSNIWKGVGWGTIIYIAAMQGIDIALYDVAKIDGCGPVRRIFVITLPGIKNVAVFLLILAIGGILSGGNTEQILLFYTRATYSKADTIGTWLYRIGLQEFEYSLGAALGFLQSTIGMILVLIANRISIKKTNVGIW